MRLYRAVSPARLAFVYFVALAAASACSSAGPTAPDRPAAAARPGAASPAWSPAAVAVHTGTTEVDLSGGTFTFAMSATDSISGTYTGKVAISSTKPPAASLDMQVTGGTGLFAGAAGSLSGDGAGAFLAEGAFQLSVRGSLSTTADPGVRFRSYVEGSSSFRCVNNAINVLMQGTGTAQKIGAVTATLEHPAPGGGCNP